MLDSVTRKSDMNASIQLPVDVATPKAFDQSEGTPVWQTVFMHFRPVIVNKSCQHLVRVKPALDRP